jgi:lysozyme family protein
LNRLGADLEEDAVLGPATLAAAENRGSDDINRELVEVRLRFYNAIVASDSDQGAFIDGWRKRAMALA